MAGMRSKIFQKLKVGSGAKVSEAQKDKQAHALYKACESYAEEVEVSNHLLKQ